MPTYEYECEQCGHAFEEFQSITAKALKKCPKCGKPKLHRLIGTGAGIIFKGSGFYQTDYRSDGYRKAAKAEKEPAGGSKAVDGAGSTGKAGAEKAASGSKDKGLATGKKAAGTKAGA